jgi:hypothetical protein
MKCAKNVEGLKFNTEIPFLEPGEVADHSVSERRNLEKGSRNIRRENAVMSS